MSGWVTASPPTGWGAGLESDLLSITVGTFRFSTTGRDFEVTDAVIGVRSIDGWDGRAGDSTESFAHPSGDGVVEGRRRIPARTITLQGDVKGKSAKAASEALMRLEMLADGELVVTDRSTRIARCASVRVVALVPERRSETHYRYTLTLVAPDPLRYGAGVRDLVNGANTLLNRGAADAEPVLEFVGPHGATTVQHAGGTMTLTALAAGQSRIVDVRNGDVFDRSGARVFGVQGGPAPVVPKQGGDSWTIAGLGSGSARVRRFEAWL